MHHAHCVYRGAARTTYLVETATGKIGNAFAPKKPGSEGVVRSLATALGDGPGWSMHLHAASGNINIDKAYP